MKKRILYFDLFRILSCMMIVLMHSPMPGLGTPGFVLSGISYVTAAGIGLFFMISGALVLNPIQPISVGKLIKNGEIRNSFDVFLFLRKRIMKVGIPLAFWTTVGNVLNYLGLPTAEIGVLWFLWTILGLYMLSPILIRWLTMASDIEVRLYLSIWALSLCYPWIRLFIPLEVVDTSWLYYFHGYVGYFVLGWYLSQKKQWKRCEWIILLLFFTTLSIAMPLGVLLLGVKLDFYDVFWYLSPSVVLMCVAWFVVFKRCEEKLQTMNYKVKNALTRFSNMTFGIYLVQMIIMRGILWRTEWMQNMNGLVQIVVCAILTFVLSAILTAIIKKIPYLNLVVGG